MAKTKRYIKSWENSSGHPTIPSHTSGRRESTVCVRVQRAIKGPLIDQAAKGGSISDVNWHTPSAWQCLSSKSNNLGNSTAASSGAYEFWQNSETCIFQWVTLVLQAITTNEQFVKDLPVNIQAWHKSTHFPIQIHSKAALKYNTCTQASPKASKKNSFLLETMKLPKPNNSQGH